MKILIKGAGDLATGIAYRLKKAGHDILMTECAIPTAVRRTVAFSRCVYEGEAAVEDVTAICVNIDGTPKEALHRVEDVQNNGHIAVIVDEETAFREIYKPDIVIDAIIAKRNINTKITDAKMVIGVGPGFCAGTDCHAVIETMRGHTLGRVIWNGTAEPNTGVPGVIGGYSVERIIRANADGIFYPKSSIGDSAQAGEVIAHVIDKNGAKHEVKAAISGIIRGMLQEGVEVRDGMKAGDIDPRAKKSYCFEISDKSLAIAGGALEAVDTFINENRKNKKIAAILLAAGNSERFGSNKLLECVNGRPMAEHMIEAVEDTDCCRKIIVTQYEEIKEMAEQHGFTVVKNPYPEKGISYSIKLGLQKLIMDMPDVDGVLFSVCDQPYIKKISIDKLIGAFQSANRNIACMTYGDRLGNPNIFGREYFAELLCLEGDVGGKKVIKQHMSDVVTVAAMENEELEDIDRAEQLISD